MGGILHYYSRNRNLTQIPNTLSQYCYTSYAMCMYFHPNKN